MSGFEYSRATTFAESDAAGMVHFSRFACFVEEAEHACLARVGYPISLRQPEALHWPRVSFSANYHAPVLPLETVSVHLEVSEVGDKSLCWIWKVLRADTVLAEGEMKTVCCRVEAGKLQSTSVPDDLRSRLTSL